MRESDVHARAGWQGRGKAVLLPACAVGLFFVWFEMAFRAATPLVSGTSGWLLLTRADVGWLTALAVAALVGLVGSASLVVLARRGDMEGQRAFRDCTAGRAGVGFRQDATRRVARLCRCACVAGAAFMAAGTALLVTAGGRPASSLVGGIASGVGMALLVASWLPATVRVDSASALLIVIVSALVSAGLTAGVMLLQAVAASAFLTMCPLLCGACSLAAMRATLLGEERGLLQAGADEPTTVGASGTTAFDGDVRVALLDAEGIAILLTLAASSVVAGIACIHMDMTLASPTYWYVSLSGVINAGLLAGVLRLFGRDRLQPALMILVSTAVAVMPLSLAFFGEVPCFVLTKVASLCAYGLAMVRFAEAGSNLRVSGTGAALLGHHARCLSLLALMALAAAFGVGSGDTLRRVVGDEGLTRMLPLVAVGLLYVVFVFYVVCVADGRRTILHVITGSFDSEAELARVRRDVILQDHDDISARESDVLLLVLQGYSTPRIADALCISENTAKTHLRHIYAKMGVSSRQQLMARAEAIKFKK